MITLSKNRSIFQGYFEHLLKQIIKTPTGVWVGLAIMLIVSILIYAIARSIMMRHVKKDTHSIVPVDKRKKIYHIATLVGVLVFAGSFFFLKPTFYNAGQTVVNWSNKWQGKGISELKKNDKTGNYEDIHDGSKKTKVSDITK